VVTFHTDATIYLSEFEAQHTVTFPTDGSRRVFLYLTDGDLDVLGQELHAKDQARIDPEAALTLAARADVRFVLIDVPSCRGWGYDQETLRGVRR
jgi:quercetin 2,3-dioxygenase